ncbi:SIR2 family protein [Simplicispira suum]|uniref:SIR2 family protein n=1 Tax=Simplicispira suum TaxID=2109915 RepID=UPI001B809CA6|nr:SIR2 family protein [Simplicispira suum]
MAKTPLDFAQLMAQECISKAPVIILGSGASAAYGIPGMPALRARLLATPAPVDATDADSLAWDSFKEHLKTVDLETALTEFRLSETMTRHVVIATWEFLAPSDASVFEKLLEDRTLFPLTRLFRHLFASIHNSIDVVTPNYDLLAEYAADAGEICHYTGFGYGHLRLRTKESLPKIYLGKTVARTVNVWKVHGSFDWFRDKAGVVMALPGTGRRPADLEPVIVTPGIEKYRLTHDEPFLSIKQGADLALQSARAYFCVGYGFNDPHMQTKLVERCRAEPVPLVLITKEITPTAKAFLKSGQCKHYMALEESGTGCRLYSTTFPDGVDIPGQSLWSLDKFLTMVIT